MSATHKMEPAEAALAWKYINVLRCAEGHSVEVLCDNPEGPCAVVCMGDWTNWQPLRIEGATAFEALTNAYRQYAGERYGEKEITQAAPASPPISDAMRDAASDILAALKLAETHIASVCADTMEADLPDWFADLTSIRVAIAKAEGRSAELTATGGES